MHNVYIYDDNAKRTAVATLPYYSVHYVAINVIIIIVVVSWPMTTVAIVSWVAHIYLEFIAARCSANLRVLMTLHYRCIAHSFGVETLNLRDR